MTLPSPSDYREARSRFAVTRDLARQALAWAQPFAMESLGIHAQRQTLIDGELPAYLAMTTPETNGGWGELMPLWFKPYERPVPFYCLDNWTLFALLYQSAFGSDADTSAFTIENLARVMFGADLLIPFLPGADGTGRFLRHGALPMLLAMLWLESGTREAWLAMHACGARRLASEKNLRQIGAPGNYLDRVEQDAWMVAEGAGIAGEAIGAFLADVNRAQPYATLFSGVCLSVSALAAEYGADWRRWIFQAVNVAYRLPDFGLAQLEAWLSRA
jgi:hypothetical protein